MQITLNQDEIEDAIKAYIGNQISVRENQVVEVELRAGRGDNGFSATLDIRSTTIQTPQPKPSLHRPRSVETAKPEPVEEPTVPATAPSADAAPEVEAADEKPAPKPRKVGSIFSTVKPSKKPEPVEAVEPTPEPEEETAPKIPDEETPEQEEARWAETEDAAIEEAPEEAPAPKKTSIFNLSQKKSG